MTMHCYWCGAQLERSGDDWPAYCDIACRRAKDSRLRGDIERAVLEAFAHGSHFLR